MFRVNFSRVASVLMQGKMGIYEVCNGLGGLHRKDVETFIRKSWKIRIPDSGRVQTFRSNWIIGISITDSPKFLINNHIWPISMELLKWFLEFMPKSGFKMNFDAISSHKQHGLSMKSLNTEEFFLFIFKNYIGTSNQSLDFHLNNFLMQ